MDVKERISSSYIPFQLLEFSLEVISLQPSVNKAVPWQSPQIRTGLPHHCPFYLTSPSHYHCPSALPSAQTVDSLNSSH